MNTQSLSGGGGKTAETVTEPLLCNGSGRIRKTSLCDPVRIGHALLKQRTRRFSNTVE